jgi:glutathione S-transferase
MDMQGDLTPAATASGVRASDEPTLGGVNIFHAAGLSNCSHRVIMTAIEKAIPWRSHPVDLAKDEQRHPRYLRINPRGLVPALVHDGRVVLESNTIIEYLDREFPGPRLMPGNTGQRAEVQALLVESNAVQWDIKITTFEFLLKRFARKTPTQLQQYAATQVDGKLVEFHRKFSTTGFDREELVASVTSLRQHLHNLERRLTGSFLCGDGFTLADISWIVNVHRFDLIGMPLGDFPRVLAWHDALKLRPSYIKATELLESPGMLAAFQSYRAERSAQGTGVTAFL